VSNKHQPLTDEQIDTAWDCWFGERGFQASPKEARREFARAIERATAARAESAEAERDRLRDALIECRPAVQLELRYWERVEMRLGFAEKTAVAPTKEKIAMLSALLDTIDAAAKGQG